MNLQRLLQAAVQYGASDVHLKPGRAPIIRINGELHELTKHPRLSPPDIIASAELMMDDRQVALFKEQNEIDLAYSLPGLGRFRVNIFRQRGSIAVALRIIPYQIRTFAELHMPPVLEKIAADQRGMVVVTGATGSGKSTTLASMIDYINSNRTCHIITVEDPIEFLIRDKKSAISQREVGIDTKGFLTALRAALRQDPDVILVGEMRDLETMTTALQAAETGHFVLSTLHTTDVMETISRILAVFPPGQENQVRFQLSTSLKAIICQRLVPRADGSGRVPAVEVLVSNARVQECIKEPKKTSEIPDIMTQSYTTYGMQSFDMSLMQLVRDKLITVEAALQNATNPGDFKLRLQGVSGADEARFDEYSEGVEKKKKGPGGGGTGGGGGAGGQKGGNFGDLIERFSE
ncbi:MAG: type IV pilus twitching motility protein PilT [Myxococcales bacterium]|nr:type IV pilus twitching motility protein PilT [Myxococcales bacterium]